MKVAILVDDAVAILVDDAVAEKFLVGVEILALADDVVMGDDVEEFKTELSNEGLVHAYEDKPVVGNGSAEVMALLLNDVHVGNGVVGLPTGVT